MFDELGNLLAPAPQVTDAPDPGLKSQWEGFLSNPANRAGLLSFGLQAMQGSWGGPAAAFAEAAGAGLEAASGAEAETYGRAQREREFAERQATIRGNQAERLAERADRESLRREERDLRRKEMALRAVESRYDRLTSRLSKLELEDATAAELGMDSDAMKSARGAEIIRLRKEVEGLDRRRMNLSGADGAGMADAGAGTSEIPAVSAPQGVGAAPAETPPAANVGANSEGAHNGMPVQGGGGIIGGPLGWLYKAARSGSAPTATPSAAVVAPPAKAAAPSGVAADIVAKARANPAMLLALRRDLGNPAKREAFVRFGTSPEEVMRLLEGK